LVDHIQPWSKLCATCRSSTGFFGHAGDSTMFAEHIQPWSKLSATRCGAPTCAVYAPVYTTTHNQVQAAMTFPLSSKLLQLPISAPHSVALTPAHWTTSTCCHQYPCQPCPQYLAPDISHMFHPSSDLSRCSLTDFGQIRKVAVHKSPCLNTIWAQKGNYLRLVAMPWNT
jgi:hypothetical protein